jgi:hypothetical protein
MPTGAGRSKASSSEWMKYDDELSKSQIRLLLLEPGQRRDPVRCQLQTVDLLQSEPWFYDALSYTWGLPTPTRRKVFIDGTAVFYRENLWRFLVERRHLKRPLYLWIDAICINQQNNHERTDQVAKMREIYATANEVSVWLGQEDADSDTAMKFLVTVLESSSMSNDIFHAQYSTPRHSKHWTAVLALLSRPYWGRVWIIQEIINASSSIRIYCGRLTVTWEAIDCVLQILSAEPTKSDEFQMDPHSPPRLQHEILKTMAAEIWRHSRQLSGNGTDQVTLASVAQMTLFDLMVRYRKSSCTDMRDKIFALLGLVHNDHTALHTIEIEYAKTLTEVFLDVHTYYAKMSSHAHLTEVLEFNSFLQQLLNVQSPANHPLPLQKAQRGVYYTCSTSVIGEVVESYSDEANRLFDAKVYQEMATKHGISRSGKELCMEDITLSLQILQEKLDRCTHLTQYKAFAVLRRPLSLRISCEVNKLRNSYNTVAQEYFACQEGEGNPSILYPKTVFLASNGDLGIMQGSVDSRDIIIGFVGSQAALIFSQNLEAPLLKSVAYMSRRLNVYAGEGDGCEQMASLRSNIGLTQVEIDPLGIWALFAKEPEAT